MQQRDRVHVTKLRIVHIEIVIGNVDVQRTHRKNVRVLPNVALRRWYRT